MIPAPGILTTKMIILRSFVKRSVSTQLRSSSNIKLSESVLKDTFGRFHNYLRISLTEKCNLRCVYCMPEEGVSLTPRNNLMSLDERKRAINIFSKLGVNKLRFTGGEPTISNQLRELISHATLGDKDRDPIKSIGITSNGLVLKDKLDSLIAAGLTSINISMDTLSESKFASITRRDAKNHHRVMSSIYSAVAKGLPVKINVVLMRGVNDCEIVDFVRLTRELKVDVRFIELMPFDGNEWSPEKFMGFHEVIDEMKSKHGVALVRVSKESSSDPHDTTKWFTAGEGYLGRVGFITSMSSHFCGSCNRLRITADGRLKVCLFGEEGLSLRDSMRAGMTDDEIAELIGQAVRQKKAVLGGHGSAEGIAKVHNRPMILIGG